MNVSSNAETSVEDLESDDLAMLLIAAKESENNGSLGVHVPRLQENASFDEAFGSLPSKENNSVLNGNVPKTHIAEEVDSSDDEEVKNFLERKYNEYGADINKKIKQQNAETKDQQVSNEIDRYIKSKFSQNLENGVSKQNWAVNKQNNNQNTVEKPPISNNKPVTNGEKNPLKKFEDKSNASSIYTDPIFGLRLINPLISSTVLSERMAGKTPVATSSIAFHIKRGDLTKDWVIAGAIVSKSAVKTTKNGQPYSIWKLSDLRGDIKMVSLFLFKGAHKHLWKTNTGMIIAVLNPGVFDKGEDQRDEASLSIDSAQKVMILGQSKDLGVCKSKKKNGEPCTSIVNLYSCEFCVYHVKQEFDRMSKRAELQSSTAGRGLHDLRNKILGKNEVFYGGQSYMAIPAKKSAKHMAKDQKRLMTLSEYYQSPNAGSVNHISKVKTNTLVPYAEKTGPQSKIAAGVDFSRKQRAKDLERLKLLNGGVATPISEPQPEVQNTSVPDKFKNSQFSFSQGVPKLSQNSFSFDINLNHRDANKSKLKALNVLNKTPLEKANPNFVKYRGTSAGKKRLIEELGTSDNNEPKKQKLEDQEKDRKSRIQKIIEATSSHTNLIQSRQDEEQEKYFNKLEKKEALEEKMLNTYKIPCKAVICSKCKYTAFSAADRCKEERHPLKVVDAEKRFFQCQDCGNRTATVHKIPKLSCNNCQSSRWQRAAMIKDRKSIQPSENLSIRGDEEKFLGSLNASASINLLVPE